MNKETVNDIFEGKLSRNEYNIKRRLDAMDMGEDVITVFLERGWVKKLDFGAGQVHYEKLISPPPIKGKPIAVNSTKAKFLEYHRSNPHIYEAFKRLALQKIKDGAKRYGSKKIFEDIRFEYQIAGKGDFRVNNNYTSLFARLFEQDYPQHEGFFRKRKSKFD